MGSGSGRPAILASRVQAAQLITDYLQRGVVGFAVNMAAVDRAELDEMRLYVDMARRVGVLFGAPGQGHNQKGERF